MARAVVRRRGQITLPREVREALHVEEGDDVAFIVADGRVTMSGLKSIPAEQAWFWTNARQAGEREASEQTTPPAREPCLTTAAPSSTRSGRCRPTNGFLDWIRTGNRSALPSRSGFGPRSAGSSRIWKQVGHSGSASGERRARGR